MPEHLSNSKYWEYLEDRCGSVVANFTPTSVPQGAAPEGIRQQWVGISLPVREGPLRSAGGLYTLGNKQIVIDGSEAVPVLTEEAILALMVNGLYKAAEHWLQWRAAGTTTLTFLSSEGEFDVASSIRER